MFSVTYPNRGQVEVECIRRIRLCVTTASINYYGRIEGRFVQIFGPGGQLRVVREHAELAVHNQFEAGQTLGQVEGPLAPVVISSSTNVHEEHYIATWGPWWLVGRIPETSILFSCERDARLHYKARAERVRDWFDTRPNSDNTACIIYDLLVGN